MADVPVTDELDAPAAAFPEQPPTPTRTEVLRARLLEPMPRDGWIGWAIPGIIAVLGGILRFLNLGRPHKLVFDETYYVKDGWSLIQYGVEISSRLEAKKADELFTSGNADIYGTTGSYVVHPPVGKWLIGIGEWIFGIESSFGWRFAVALLGTVSILIVGRLRGGCSARRGSVAWRHSSWRSRACT